jgi:hypothetical protein
MKTKRINLPLLLILIIVLISCHKHHEDPCASLHPVSASFVTEEDLSYAAQGWIYYSSDTIATYKVRFTASEDNATYLWLIGSGTYTQKSFSLNFPTTLTNQSIPITLIVSKTPDKNCFPGDDGKDTITKTIHFVNYKNAVINGQYQGYLEGNPSDTFTVTIDPLRPGGLFAGDSSLYITNLTRGCGRYFCYGPYPNYGYKEINFGDNVADCYSPVGNIRTNGSNNKIIINYSTADATWTKSIAYKFYGTKK